MSNGPIGAGMNCEEFREELERLPLGMTGEATAEGWGNLLPEASQAHAAKCAECQAALADFAETRAALSGMKASLPEPGPWFSARVMAQIRAQEEQVNGVWVNVRRLAPRLAAFAAVLLVLGGTWAMELRRAEQSRQQEVRPAEGLFETAPSAPLNDDIVASTYEERQP